VTDRLFAVRKPAPQRFAIEELKNVRVVCGDLDPAGAFRANTAGALAVAVAASWPLLPARALLTALVLVMTLTAISLVYFRRTPRVYELRAVYSGAEVGLFSSSDRSRFAEVELALAQAFEDRRADRS
jgi:hypothetical protein